METAEYRRRVAEMVTTHQDLYHERLVDEAQLALRKAIALLRYARWDDAAIRAAVEQCLERRA